MFSDNDAATGVTLFAFSLACIDVFRVAIMQKTAFIPARDMEIVETILRCRELSKHTGIAFSTNGKCVGSGTWGNAEFLWARILGLLVCLRNSGPIPVCRHRLYPDNGTGAIAGAVALLDPSGSHIDCFLDDRLVRAL